MEASYFPPIYMPHIRLFAVQILNALVFLRENTGEHSPQEQEQVQERHQAYRPRDQYARARSPPSCSTEHLKLSWARRIAIAMLSTCGASAASSPNFISDSHCYQAETNRSSLASSCKRLVFHQRFPNHLQERQQLLQGRRPQNYQVQGKPCFNPRLQTPINDRGQEGTLQKRYQKALEEKLRFCERREGQEWSQPKEVRWGSPHMRIRRYHNNNISIIISLNPTLPMQIRAFRLPPLPGRKAPPLQVLRRPNRMLQDETRAPSHSKEPTDLNLKQENKQNSGAWPHKRPSSVRSVSHQSRNSRESSSGATSRQKSVEMMKGRIHHNVKARVSMPLVSAKSWAIFEMKQAKLIYGKRIFKGREIASLTKIMNLIAIIELMEECKLSPLKLRFRVSRQASCIAGTSAELREGYELSLYDLYYGMMLPSGNDAAYQIAQVGGSLILMRKAEGDIRRQAIYDSAFLTEYYTHQPTAVSVYLSYMNRVSKRLMMHNSHFANPHGLSNPQNFSCAEDLCKLCSFCMENKVFRQVVNAQSYTTSIGLRQPGTTSSQSQGHEPVTGDRNELVSTTIALEWENTNKMLKEGWSGVKTGITPNAGPCLAASVERHISGRDLQFLVVLLGSASMEARWKEAKEIVQWVIAENIYF